MSATTISRDFDPLSRETVHPRRIVNAFTVVAMSAIFLEKFGVVVGSGVVAFDDFILFGSLIWLLVQGEAVIDRARFCLLLLLMSAISVGVLLGGRVGNLPALALLISLYATMTIRVDVDEATAKSALNGFQNGMIIIALIVILQQILQYSVGHSTWPNLDNLTPKIIQIQGYAYLRPYAWRSPYLTPQGVFFLEPSVCSAFLAVSVAVELLFFKRLPKLGTLILALLVQMAGTGLTALVLVSPFLVSSLDGRLRRWAIGVGAPALVAGLCLGVFSHFVDRSSELSNDNSSGYSRLVTPFLETTALLENPAFLVSGEGAGSSPKGTEVQWPANKLIYEYGTPTAVTFYVFLLFSILRNPPSRIVASVILIPHLFFGGGVVSHTNIMMLVMFGSMFRIRR